MYKNIYLIIILLLLTPNLFADFKVEPYATYGTTTIKRSVTCNLTMVKSDYEYTGTEYGAGLKAYMDLTKIIYGGIDVGYLAGSYSLTTKDSVQVQNAKTVSTTHVMAGPLAILALPKFPLDFWAAYYLFDHYTAEDEKISTKTQTFMGQGFKVGAGLNFSDDFVVGVEYYAHEYDEYEENGQTYTFEGSEYYSNVKQTSIMGYLGMKF